MTKPVVEKVCGEASFAQGASELFGVGDDDGKWECAKDCPHFPETCKEAKQMAGGCAADCGEAMTKPVVEKVCGEASFAQGASELFGVGDDDGKWECAKDCTLFPETCKEAKQMAGGCAADCGEAMTKPVVDKVCGAASFAQSASELFGDGDDDGKWECAKDCTHFPESCKE